VIVNGHARHNGLFIIRADATGLSSEMGLGAGSVLLTVDGYTMNTARVADDWLSRRPNKPLAFTWAKQVDGKWVIEQGQLVAARSKISLRSARQDQSLRSINELELMMIPMINASRIAEGGLSPVRADSGLSRLARNYAQYMLNHSAQYDLPVPEYTHHDPDGRSPTDRARELGITSEVHENIAIDNRAQNSDQWLLERQHKIMMREPNSGRTHRGIICDPDARLVGVGVARSQTRLYMVEEFSH
jgi:uncharacterized protein YkwD